VSQNADLGPRVKQDSNSSIDEGKPQPHQQAQRHQLTSSSYIVYAEANESVHEDIPSASSRRESVSEGFRKINYEVECACGLYILIYCFSFCGGFF
jgi:hypothetical protein